MNPPLPPRFREDAVRRYESTLRSILNDFPKVVVFKPTLAPTTFACRLRDAIKSQRANQWPLGIDMARFIQCCDEIVVSERTDGTVIVGNAETIRNYTKLTPDAGAGFVSTSNIVIEDPGNGSLDTIVASACCLLHYRLIGPCEVRIKNPVEAQRIRDMLNNLETSLYDITHHWRSESVCVIT